MTIKLTCIVKTNSDVKLDEIDEGVVFAIRPVIGDFERNDFLGKVISSKIENNTFKVDLVIDDFIDLSADGIARIYSIAFGNTFRDSRISKVTLEEISFYGRIKGIKSLGPKYGVRGIRDILESDVDPILSYPMPVFSFDNDWASLLDKLCSAGVVVFTDSPLESFKGKAYLLKKIEHIENIVSSSSNRVIYFINGTTSINNLITLRGVISKHQNMKLKLGLRICPASMGLNVIAYIRAKSVPIYGYSLIDQVEGHESSKLVSSKTHILLLRLAGCDIVNVGLTSDVIIDTSIEYASSRSATQHIYSGIDETLLAFTGNLTPQRANKLYEKYSDCSMMHLRSPLTGYSLERKQIFAIASAFIEAMVIGQTGENYDTLLAEESKQTKYLRLTRNLFQ